MVMPGVDGAAARLSGYPRPPDRLGSPWMSRSPGCAPRHRPEPPGPAVLLAAVPLGGLSLIAVASGIL